ncbi:MAG: GtrA family protein [bacterium]|nr:GtrA family protein [bacterium]
MNALDGMIPAGFRFGLVGLVATGVYLVFAALTIAAGVNVLVANGIAFLIAHVVSLCGHHAFSFHGRTSFWRGARRFIPGALVAFVANNLVLAGLVATTGDTYLWLKLAFAILVIPPVTFGYAYFFAYRD